MQANPTPSHDEIIVLYSSLYRSRGTTGYNEQNFTNRHLSQARYITDHFSKLNSMPSAVVDIGAGHGQLLSILKKEYPKSRFYATELDPRLTKKLERNGIITKNILIEDCDNNAFDVRFDLLICSHVLEHAINPRTFLTILHSMLKPGGIAMFEVPNCGLPYYWGSDSPHLSFFTERSLSYALETSRFKIIDIHPGGPNGVHYIRPFFWGEKLMTTLRIEFNKFLKQRLPNGIYKVLKNIKGSLTQGRNAFMVKNLKHHEDGIEKESKELFYKTNPDGIFLRALVKLS